MDFEPLSQKFFKEDTLSLAQLLLGKTLLHCSSDGRTAGKIVETEAYCQDDPACHASRGRTQRNAVMFGPAGFAYVYLVYGKHFCFNVVAGQVGAGEAVLIRALEPLLGLDLIYKRRGKARKVTDLLSGPGKLCAGMAITGKHNGLFLREEPLFIAAGMPVKNNAVVRAPRIGISQAKEKEWRYYLKDNAYVSRIIK